MHNRLFACIVVFAAVLLCISRFSEAQLRPPGVLPPLRPKIDPASITDEQVLTSVNKGVDFLLTAVDAQVKVVLEAEDPKRGMRPPPVVDERAYGEIILATYTLLHIGQQIDDPRLRFNSPQMTPLVHLLTKLNIDFNYATALQACALAQLPPKPEYKRALALVTEKLVNGVGKEGGYTYKLTHDNYVQSMLKWDNSNSQYGLLGVWAAADWGLETSNGYWQKIDQFWRRVQCLDGGWDYLDGSMKSYPSMTAAGVASLYVTTEYIDRTPRREPHADGNLDRGLAALIKTFDPDANNLYYLYAVERVGLASGLKFFNKTNWYRAAAANVLSLQNPDGSFSSTFIGATPTVNTSYALLFLIRGRAPVVMNKLQYNGAWNVRPRDSANLTRFFAKSFEKHINWQIVGIDNPVAEWLDAPILLITFNREPAFTNEEVSRLREFVNSGGIIFSVAEQDRQATTDAVKRCAAKVAGDQYEMRILPKDHPLFSIETKFKMPPTIWGLSNGVRELWVHVPTDYAASWQSRSHLRTEAWDIPTNLYFYATGKGSLRSKLQSLVVPEPTEEPRRKIGMARLQYAGNWDPEPGAWMRMSKLMRTRYHTALDLDYVKINRLNAESSAFTVAHLTGTSKCSFTDLQVAELRKFIDNGGTLLIDSAGGSRAFTDSAKTLLSQAWPDAALVTLPPEHELYTPFVVGADTVPVEYRKFWILTHGPCSLFRVQALTVGKRLAVFFSADDISSGLLGTSTWGIDGYAPACAEALARNLVLWSVKDNPAEHVPVTTAPASQPATSPATEPASQPATSPDTQPALPPATAPATAPSSAPTPDHDPPPPPP